MEVDDVIPVKPHLCKAVVATEILLSTVFQHITETDLLIKQAAAAVGEVNTILDSLHLEELCKVDCK